MIFHYTSRFFLPMIVETGALSASNGKYVDEGKLL